MGMLLSVGAVLALAGFVASRSLAGLLLAQGVVLAGDHRLLCKKGKHAYTARWS